MGNEKSKIDKQLNSFLQELATRLDAHRILFKSLADMLEQDQKSIEQEAVIHATKRVKGLDENTLRVLNEEIAASMKELTYKTKHG